MASDRSHKQRPQGVTLPPISQIFNTIPSSSAAGSNLSLPPLRVGQEGNQGGHQTDSRSNRAYGTSTSHYAAGVPELEDPRMKRPRYDQSAPSGSSYPPAVNRAASYGTPSSVTSPYQSSAVVHTERTGNRFTGVPSSSYGPSPYSYNPSPSNYAHFPPHYAGSGESSRVPAVGDPRRDISRGQDPMNIVGQGSHPDEGQSKANRYECSYCGKGFLRPSALKIHIISHTGDKDFTCPEENCGRRFGVRSNMLRHIRLVHQNNHSQSSGEELTKDDDWSE